MYKYVKIMLLVTGFLLINSANAALSAEDSNKHAPELANLINLGKVWDAGNFVRAHPEVVNGSITHSGAPCTMLDFAIVKGQNEIAKNLLANNAPLTTTGETTLHKAAVSGNTEIIDEILKKNKDLLNARNENSGFTPLVEAILAQNKDNVSHLLTKSDLDLSIQDNGHITPLCRAVIKGYVELVELLLAKRPSPSKRASLTEKNGDKKHCEYTVLHKVLEMLEASMKSPQKEKAKAVYNLLIEKEYEDDIREVLLVADSQGSTPLHVALRLKDKAIAEKFLDIAKRGNDTFKEEFKTKVLNELGKGEPPATLAQAPLHLAVSFGFGEPMIKQLIELGANPSQKDSSEKKPLDYYISSQYSKEDSEALSKLFEEAEEKAKIASSTSSSTQPNPPATTTGGPSGSPLPLQPTQNPSQKKHVNPAPSNPVPQASQPVSKSSTLPVSPSVKKAPEGNSGSQIGTPSGSNNPSPSHSGGNDTTQDKNKFLKRGGALIGIPLLVIGLVYGIRSMLKNNNKKTDEHGGNVYNGD